MIDPKYHECCGNCHHHRKQGEEWICDNEYGDSFGFETEYLDCCDDYEPRE